MLLFPLCVVFLSSMTLLIDAKACTDIKLPAMVDFNMTKFLGTWYAIKGSDTSERCVTYEFEKTTTPNQYRVIKSSAAKKDERHTIGSLVFAGENNEANMIVDFPSERFNERSFIVFETNYATYAGIYICKGKKLGFKDKDAIILSRKPTLGEDYIKKLQRRLKQFKVNNSMKKIDNEKCPYREAELTTGTINNIASNTAYARKPSRKVAPVVKKPKLQRKVRTMHQSYVS